MDDRRETRVTNTEVHTHTVSTELQPIQRQSRMCYFNPQTTLTHSIVLESYTWNQACMAFVASRAQYIPTLPLSQDHHNLNNITCKKYKQEDTTKHLAVHAASCAGTQTVSSSSAWLRCPRLDQLWRSTPHSSLDFQ
jgi:hypothetical protein